MAEWHCPMKQWARASSCPVNCAKARCRRAIVHGLLQLGAAVVHVEQARQNLQLLLRRTGRAGQLPRSQKHLQRLLRCIALDRHDRGAQGQMQPQLGAVPLGRRRQLARQPDGFREMLDGVDQRRSAHGSLARLHPVPAGGLRKTGLGEVIGHDLRLCGDRRREPVLQRDRDALMQGLALAARQHCVGGALDECVAECVGFRECQLRQHQQLGVDKLLHRLAQVIGRAIGHDGTDEIEIELAPDRRRNPRHVLRLSEPV